MARFLLEGIAQVLSLDSLHHLVLCHPAIGFHSISSILVAVFNIRQAQGSTTVDVSSKLSDGSFSVIGTVKFHHTCTTRSSVGFVLDLGTLDLSDGGEQLDKIIVAGGPWEL